MKPSIPKGTRDFLPREVKCREYIFNTLREIFELYDFQPIETPAMENLQTLTGKYGDEGDQLLFKILNNGDFLSKVDPEIRPSITSSELLPKIAKRGLRYDLTVPLARFVVMHQNELSFPFKRYQIQPVWRGDRPQKGRYQEFYQCDVDIIGSPALLYEAELIKIYDEAFRRLQIPVEIKVNNRKILEGIAEVIGVKDEFQRFTIILDKLDKVQEAGVRQQYLDNGYTQNQIDKIFKIVSSPTIEKLEEHLSSSAVGSLGVEELKSVSRYLKSMELQNQLRFDWTLARGLSYYTGCIFEVLCPQVNIGSIGGGGRYDDLTGVFGWKGNSGVGISFGAARIYDVMRELDVFPEDINQQTKILFAAFDDDAHHWAFECTMQLRNAGIPSAIYPVAGKMKRQLKYADDRNIPFVGLIGDDEMKSHRVMLKDLKSGDQKKMSIDEVISMLSSE